MKLSQIVLAVVALVAVGSVSAQSIPSGALGPNREFTIQASDSGFQFTSVEQTATGNVEVIAVEETAAK